MDEFYDWKVNDKKISRKSILITFDDGWLSNYTEIFDFMKLKKIKYNIFLEIATIYLYTK